MLCTREKMDNVYLSDSSGVSSDNSNTNKLRFDKVWKTIKSLLFFFSFVFIDMLVVKMDEWSENNVRKL